MPGKFIVLEGLDRSGKTTQCAKIAEELRKSHSNVVEMKFPDRTTAIGKLINDYLVNHDFELNDQAIHLLFSANRWEVSTKIKALISEGAIIVADRYVYSGIAFSSAKGLDIDWCAAPDRGLPEPDVVLFLDVDEQTAISRGGYGLERYETKEMQEKVRQQFLKLKTPTWHWILASGSADEVFARIKESIKLHIDI